MFSPPGGFEMGWLVCATLAVFILLASGGTFSAMDLMLLAESYRLGVKRSSIVLPWERTELKSVFGKRQRLIPAPKFAPEPGTQEPQTTFGQKEVAGKVTWSRVTSVIPWPVAQERSLSRALENWRIIVSDDLETSVLGRQIRSILDGTVHDMTVEQVIRDSFAGKSVSTLRSRASSVMAFARWKKAMDDDAKIFPVSEDQAYRYVLELRQLNAPRTKPTRFLESLTFVHHMIGADVGQCLNSPRLRGAVITPMVPPKKKVPLETWQVAAFENIAMHGTGQEAVFAGYVCMVLHARLRWSDGQYCQYEPYVDLHHGTGFLEGELYHHKTAGRQKQSRRLLPMACCVPGLMGDWATPWLHQREVQELRAGPGIPTMPVPLACGRWGQVPLEPAQATTWIREIIGKLRPSCDVSELATHSLKATLLSWMAKCSCPEDLRRLAGYHVDPGSKSALEYSRDAQAPVLHAIEGIMMIIRENLFNPDVSRAQRWRKPQVRTLQDAMLFLSQQSHVHADVLSEPYEPESPLKDGWSLCGSDGDVSLSSLSEGGHELFENGCQTSDEDRDAEVAAPIVGASIANELHYSIKDVDVFKHVKSGCCHVAKQSQVDDEDGEPIVLRCGKIATKNFVQMLDVANFMPYKCTRCFAGLDS
eukprot:s2442_g13.t1